MTPELHMVTIETETTGRITLTPAQFSLLLEAALVGLEARPDPSGAAKPLRDIVAKAAAAHTQP